MESNMIGKDEQDMGKVMSIPQLQVFMKAVDEAGRKNWPRCAAFYRNLLETMPIGSTPVRFYIFISYTMIFRHGEIRQPQKEDLQFLQAREKDEKEDTIIRCLVSLTRGLIAYMAHDRGKAATHYRRGIENADKMDKSHLDTHIYLPNHSTGLFKHATPRSAHQEHMHLIRNNLAILEGRPHEPYENPTFRSGGVAVSLGSHDDKLSKSDHEKIDEALLWLRREPKDICHACGKENTTLPTNTSDQDASSGATKMKVCSKCRLVKYCSKKCQRTDWKEGMHRLRCRPPGTFVAGDMVILINLEKRPDLNRKLVEIRQVPSEGKGPRNKAKADARYVVGEVGSDKSFAVKKMNLKQVLPIAKRNH